MKWSQKLEKYCNKSWKCIIISNQTVWLYGWVKIRLYKFRKCRRYYLLYNGRMNVILTMNFSAGNYYFEAFKSWPDDSVDDIFVHTLPIRATSQLSQMCTGRKKNVQRKSHMLNIGLFLPPIFMKIKYFNSLMTAFDEFSVRFTCTFFFYQYTLQTAVTLCVCETWNEHITFDPKRLELCVQQLWNPKVIQFLG